MKNIQILDDAISDDLMDACIWEAEGFKYSLLTNYTDAGTYKHQFIVYDDTLSVPFTNKIFLLLWEEIKKYVPDHAKLLRCYLNAHPYGVEDAIHVDEKYIKDGLTVVIYLCNDWYPEWFGETVFWSSGERHAHNDIVKSVMPRRNRVVIFDKNIPHCVAPLSRRFFGIRFTCMFKLGFDQ